VFLIKFYIKFYRSYSHKNSEKNKMTDKLVEYVIELNTNPEALEKHNTDPANAAAEFGLDTKDISIITNKDTEEVKQRCASSTKDVKNTMICFFKQ